MPIYNLHKLRQESAITTRDIQVLTKAGLVMAYGMDKLVTTKDPTKWPIRYRRRWIDLNGELYTGKQNIYKG